MLTIYYSQWHNIY